MARPTRRRGRAVTMADVAARAGVSAMSVSNVINESGRMSDATRRRIRAAIDELGYTPDAAARRLAGGSATRLGVVFKRSHSEFVGETLVSALEVASAHGVQLLLHDCREDNAAAIESGIRALVERGAQSLLLLPPFAEIVAERAILGALNVPVAAVGTGRALPGMITVRIDERAAAAAMTALLIDRGHRRIGFIAGPPSHSGALARREGHEQALRDRAIPIHPELQASGDYNFNSGLGAARTLIDLPDRPTAIFASNDEMAAAVAWIAHSRGLTLPADLAIAGFDDAPIASRVFPALSAVRQPVSAMAAHATRLLIAEMRDAAADNANEAPQDVVLPFELVERQSTPNHL